MNTCRFCKESTFHPETEGVRYGPRHFAHFACYLDAGKTLEALTKWQVGRFPFKMLKERGLFELAIKLTTKTRTGRISGIGPGNITEVSR